MGLSSKQVSSDGLDWSQTLLQQAQTLELPKPPLLRRQQQQNQQQSEPLKCPRCDSTKTKFCYYNNYNKSQPRHFCKTCKRHWTKGGTLRNVPVGGGRKNKRLKTSKNTSKAASAAATTSATSTSTNNGNIINRVDPQMVIQAQQQKHNHPLTLGDQKSVSEIKCQAMISPLSLAFQQNSMSCSNFSSKNFNTGNNGVFMGPTFSLPQNQGLHFPYSSSSTFETHPSSIFTSLQPSNLYNYSSGEAMEDSTITTVIPTTSNIITHQLWQVPNASCGVDMTSYWNWDDIDTFVSTDLNIPWDDSGLKP
ncbi:hypothetical protein P3X46_033298 [Hevea brasiliensis]|uniref:Dof zinc finger protein n=1 Tax=Hevea brasiliensis TaxID=3981 RepID=A0ABQ9KFX3_HEVBR|nr:dof zinc finger protein DOF1.4-like [Hevea brasiliensis]KAJ9136197.1 hypothetical protein P3X46_033298 [Hevea brasiliensis]